MKNVIENIKFIVQMFVFWVTRKLSAQSEDEIIHGFEKETYINFDLEKQFEMKAIQRKRL